MSAKNGNKMFTFFVIKKDSEVDINTLLKYLKSITLELYYVLMSESASYLQWGSKISIFQINRLYA